MSELIEPAWAVISERGCEASHITYEEALSLIQRLGHEGIYGRCIVTADAASRMNARAPEDAVADAAQRKS